MQYFDNCVLSVSYGVIMSTLLKWLYLKTSLAMCAAEPSLRKDLVFTKETSPHVLLIFAESVWMQSCKKSM